MAVRDRFETVITVIREVINCNRGGNRGGHRVKILASGSSLLPCFARAEISFLYPVLQKLRFLFFYLHKIKKIYGILTKIYLKIIKRYNILNISKI